MLTLHNYERDASAYFLNHAYIYGYLEEFVSLLVIIIMAFQLKTEMGSNVILIKYLLVQNKIYNNL